MMSRGDRRSRGGSPVHRANARSPGSTATRCSDRAAGRPTAEARASGPPGRGRNGRGRRGAGGPGRLSRAMTRSARRRPARPTRRPGSRRERATSRAPCADLGCRLAIILAVIPFRQVRLVDGPFQNPASSQVRRARSRGWSEPLKLDSTQSLAQAAHVGFAALGQRDVGSAGVLMRKRPGRLSVPCQID